jgi:phosphoglycolate phosphatase
MKFTDKKLIIFDLDGTLIDSSSDLALAINHMLKTLGRESFSINTIYKWIGNGSHMLVKRALSGARDIDENIDPKLFEEALGIFLDFYSKNLTQNTKTYPNVKETLKRLKEHGYTLAIVTNKPFGFVNPILKELELDGLFSLILGGDSLNEKKPSPLPLLHTCKTLGYSVKESLMVGDSQNDILSANACKMDSIGLTYGYNYGKPISIYKPTAIFDDFSDILSTLI